MNSTFLDPRKALNKAFLKIKPNRSHIELFKFNLIAILDAINEKETEEFHKNLVIDFLKKTYYDPHYFVNTKGRNDLVIHNGKDAKTPVGVIIEVKSPSNKSEMISVDNLNGKALQELVLYYLRERITHKNTDLKQLVVTNIYEWFVFDAQHFNSLFAENKKLVKDFIAFENGSSSSKKTDFFYKEIAKPFIDQIQQTIEFAYFDIRTYDAPLRNSDAQDDKLLIALFKLLSPEHLLKLSFANDSNSLDKNFYNELLHLIGLTETKEGGKKLIERPKVGQRHAGSLLENVINQLDSLDKVSRLPNVKQYGDTHEERLFTVGLELCITWVNRILFLKLLEAQLISYHKGDKSYAFLNKTILHDYDNLNALFFMVLAKKPEDRNDRVKTLFAKVPYLNSSLFEPTELEHLSLFISGLEDSIDLPFLSGTVIKDTQGKKRTGAEKAIAYFFDFLDAYDFASEGSEDIQEDNKTLINASVLGLIFEKINGYKDGSFYTPSFITMYMCKETIRRAVVQKFNETKGWDCQDFLALQNKDFSVPEANAIINSVKICDPAVGSGHFLVSALNEMIAIKHDLKVLVDREGKRLKEYQVEIVNDELLVTDEDGLPFAYNPIIKESQRVQETFFHEKQTIIENCLFGVDINPNSVKICRLRLWIELLKNAYYRTDKSLRVPTLETLPNIDINIKCGNSLIARFGLDADLKEALQKSNLKIDDYKRAVDQYRNAESKEQKREMETLIEQIKSSFRSDFNTNDPKLAKIYKLKGEVAVLHSQTDLFGLSKKEETARAKKTKEISTELHKLEGEIEELKSNKIYENAFEWRFEFPEVLNDQGDFVGFDVVIGNPPYLLVFDNKIKDYLNTNYSEIKQNYDLYVTFIIQGNRMMKADGQFSFITPNTFLKGSTFENLRNYIINNFQINEIIDFGNELVFEDANVFCSIINCSKSKQKNDWILKNSIHDVKGKISFNSNEFILISELVKKLNNFKKLEEYFLVKDVGFNYWSEGRGKVRGDSIGSRVFYKGTKINDLDLSYIKGSNINKYSISSPDNFLLNNWKDYLNENDTFRFSEELLKSKEKIVYRQTSNQIIASLDTNQNLCDKTVHIIINKDNNISLKYLLSILNSKLMNYYFKSYKEEEGRAFAQVKTVDIKNLPFVFDDKLEFALNLKVDQILTLKKDNPAADTSVLEREIDVMVYALYGLTEEEIKIVEES
jgi:ribosomal protein S17E